MENANTQHLLGNGRIQPPDGLAFFPILPLGEGRDEGWSHATLLPHLSAVVQRSGTKEEPFDGGGFDDGFIEEHLRRWIEYESLLSGSFFV
jgi:hypothetical protein